MQHGTAYQVHKYAQPSELSYQEDTSKVVKKVSEETEVIEIPAQYGEVTPIIEEKKRKLEPISFQVSTVKENVMPLSSSTTTAADDTNDPNPFKIFGAKLRSRPIKGIVPSYEY